jgi:hypothetical protein
VNVAPHKTSDFYGVGVLNHDALNLEGSKRFLSQSHSSELFKFFRTGHIIRPHSQLNDFDSEKGGTFFCRNVCVTINSARCHSPEDH